MVTDHLGSVRSVVRSTDGIVVQALTYDSWGRVLSDTNPGFQPFGYAGGIYDKDTGLVHFGAREYDAVTSRWTSKDTGGFSGGLNLYQYTRGDPVNYIDRDGRIPFPVLIAAVAAFASVFLADNQQDAMYAAGTAIAMPFVGEAFNALLARVFAADAPLIGRILQKWWQRACPTVRGFVDDTRGGLRIGPKGGRLSRFDGPKPAYHVNEAHVPGRGLRPGKTPLPADAEDVFKNAVPSEANTPKAWFGKNPDGEIYRYSLGNDGTAYFSGIEGVGEGTRNLTQYAAQRLGGQ